MISTITIRLLGVPLWLGLFAICSLAQRPAVAPPPKTIVWTDVLKQKSDWYGSAEAVGIADNVLLYQRDTGGWPKNIDMAKVLKESEVTSLISQKQKIDSNIERCVGEPLLPQYRNRTRGSCRDNHRLQL